MSWEAWFTVGVILAVLYGMVRNLPADALVVGGVVLCGLAGILTPIEVFDGFANHGMLTVAALFVVTAGLRETGALDMLGHWLLGRARTESAVLGRMAASVTGMSAFLNNTPIVAMFIPIVTDWCRKNRVAPSRLLIPLSYLSIFGGTCTLIGTSTNLVVNGLMIQQWKVDPERFADLAPMSLFEMSRVGIPYAIAGILYLWLVGRRVLPSRKAFLEKMGESVREYLVNLQIQAGCRLAGQKVEDAGLRHLPGLFLIEIVRNDEVIAPVGPDQLLAEGDILTFTGSVEYVVELEKIQGLVPLGDAGYETAAANRRDRSLCEAVVSSTSPILGQTIRDSNFRARYNAAIIAVHRGGKRLLGRVGDIELEPGDTLLLQAGPHFLEAHRDNADFYLISGIENSRPLRHDRALLSLALLALLILLMATGIVDIVMAAFLVAGLMVATRCISVNEARTSVDYQTLITIAGAFALGKALVNSGAADALSHVFVQSIGVLGPVAVLAGIYLLTSLFTEIITNNAAAALMFPFAVAMAQEMSVSPRPFVLAVAFAASASFITPLGYQTNLMVFGPGGYQLGDFVKIGLPLNMLMVTIATLLIPVVWPF